MGWLETEEVAGEHRWVGWRLKKSQENTDGLVEERRIEKGNGKQDISNTGSNDSDKLASGHKESTNITIVSFVKTSS